MSRRASTSSAQTEQDGDASIQQPSLLKGDAKKVDSEPIETTDEQGKIATKDAVGLSLSSRKRRRRTSGSSLEGPRDEARKARSSLRGGDIQRINTEPKEKGNKEERMATKKDFGISIPTRKRRASGSSADGPQDGDASNGRPPLTKDDATGMDNESNQKSVKERIFTRGVSGRSLPTRSRRASDSSADGPQDGDASNERPTLPKDYTTGMDGDSLQKSNKEESKFTNGVSGGSLPTIRRRSSDSTTKGPQPSKVSNERPILSKHGTKGMDSGSIQKSDKEEEMIVTKVDVGRSLSRRSTRATGSSAEGPQVGDESNEQPPHLKEDTKEMDTARLEKNDKEEMIAKGAAERSLQTTKRASGLDEESCAGDQLESVQIEPDTGNESSTPLDSPEERLQLKPTEHRDSTADTFLSLDSSEKNGNNLPATPPEANDCMNHEVVSKDDETGAINDYQDNILPTKRAGLNQPVNIVRSDINNDEEPNEDNCKDEKEIIQSASSNAKKVSPGPSLDPATNEERDKHADTKENILSSNSSISADENKARIANYRPGAALSHDKPFVSRSGQQTEVEESNDKPLAVSRDDKSVKEHDHERHNHVAKCDTNKMILQKRTSDNIAKAPETRPTCSTAKKQKYEKVCTDVVVVDKDYVLSLRRSTRSLNVRKREEETNDSEGSSDSEDIVLADLPSATTGKNNESAEAEPAALSSDPADVVCATLDASPKTSQGNELCEAESFPLSHLCRVVCTSQGNHKPLEYQYAPMGHLWLAEALSNKNQRKFADVESSVDLKAGGTMIGRRWVWDEGRYCDGHLDSGLERIFRVIDRPPVTASKNKNGVSIGCTCGANHSSINESGKKSLSSKSDGSARTRRSERSSSSTRMSNVVSQLADGRLNPHTLIACEDYSWGPEFRFLKNVQTESVQPFCVRVSPDATFLADLHAHLCESEIIGFLGGYYSKEEKCIYIQGAFPCKSTSRLDSGHTDVEMDPISQIYVREAISNHGMSVVGWYHSHPTFQPDPSVTDIENQANYQQLFNSNIDGEDSTNDDGSRLGTEYDSVNEGCRSTSLHTDENVPHYRRAGFISPFVGLIVGTYDAKNPSSQSVMRWFHVTSKYTEHGKFVNFPMNLKTTTRHFRTFDDNAELNDGSLEDIRDVMTERGVAIRKELESNYLSCPLTDFSQLIAPENDAKDPDNQAPNVRWRENAVVNPQTQPIGTEGSSEAIAQPGTKLVDQSDDDVAPSSSSIDHLIKDEESSLIKPCATQESVVQHNGISHPLLPQDTLFLTESIFQHDHANDSSSVESARPLYFTEEERSILGLNPKLVSYDVIGGVIWCAVERDQLIAREEMGDTGAAGVTSVPSHSRSVLELLLRQSFTGYDLFDKKLYEMIQCIGDSGSVVLGEGTSFNESDAAITHSVDAVLSHYASNSKRTNPFGTWSGAGDKGTIISRDFPTKPHADDSWKHFYLTKVLEMTSLKMMNGEISYQGGNKMKRGHKMTACLLKWASFMQLSTGFEHYSKQHSQFSHDNQNHKRGLEFDHERTLIATSSNRNEDDASQNTSNLDYIYFVAEVMRLLAARWREAKGVPTKKARPVALPQKRGRPIGKPSSSQLVEKRGRGRPKKVDSVSSEADSSQIKRGRGRPAKRRGPGRPRRKSDSS